ncbi:zinc-dependent alcohol dehydrogenase family protein [Oceanibacterium hippocampi]|uniref:alcohol dehydrogenase n=1 Tax=Oceanibacterium hippocampi TaxID=745714 RepID=A0A1Y5TZY6_9PROT|nr:zinc-dependent alcohol dehydrogenase family protein [Oceanibacterium hippocampi]SLN77740.1 Alcohol dehydrogenase [Oceanibacterium hippocampi]
MRAMILNRAAAGRLDAVERDRPDPGPGEVLVKVAACGVCRTDLHVVDGDLPEPKIPIIPGHEIVGRVVACGSGVEGFPAGLRVGIPWLGFSCGTCDYCRRDEENLCPDASFTGYRIDGGYADYACADARYVFPLPEGYEDAEAAPLLCAGLIGHRAYRMTGTAHRIGVYGFGAAAHIMIQVALYEGREVHAFTRPGDEAAQVFARELGAAWAGPSGAAPPALLDAAVIFAPVGALVPEALARIRPGGTVVCAGIHMSDIPGFPYRLLWEERVIRSVANLTRRDAIDFLAIAPKVPVRTHIRRYPLARANDALSDLRDGHLQGAAVLIP